MKGVISWIGIILLSLFTEIIKAQNPELNLIKYWNYRERLRKYFIAISPNNEKGTNIPASSITGNGYRTLSWGDGNGCLQYYIGLLATEYRLLKLFGLDYTNTRNELFYALKAVERLDITAEEYFRRGLNKPVFCTLAGTICIYSDTLDHNGFFIRDDVDESIKIFNNNLNKYTISSTYVNHINKNGLPYEQSKDNVWHYLLNLALVVKLVDDNEIKQLATDISYRMIKWMHKSLTYEVTLPCLDWPPLCTEKIVDLCWRIINPITNKDVEDGAKVDEIYGGLCCTSIDGFSYGFAEAGNWITKKELHYSCSKDKKNWFINNILSPPFIVVNDKVTHSYDTYSYRSLATVAGFDTIGGWDTYEFLVLRSYEDYDHPYEHFPLIYTILHGRSSKFDDYYQTQFERYEDLLNSAPTCGTYNFGKNNIPSRPSNWSVSNRLVWPEKIDKDDELGYYNGIDYMLLHNLFWLTYIVPETVDSYNNSGCILPHTVDFLGIPLYTIGEKTNPLIINARSSINFSCKIKANGGAKFFSKEINLMAGFEVEKGGIFSTEKGIFIPKVNKIYCSYKKYVPTTCINIP
ncbi:MAG: hypothetical protein WHT29_11795 [Bacteroidales bacterium]